MATIYEVAALAGVSPATVSRVLNGGHYVSPPSLEAVNRAIRACSRSRSARRACSMPWSMTACDGTDAGTYPLGSIVPNCCSGSRGCTAERC